ncbi:hypothetical protein [Neoroseomonas lacus]|uniref:hypothetical protein n=1 Tax=Neoroseomonas lacus TaxID=287609 RepID=UPI0016672D21|nr:hypothetical protein [Neoroseomonas lacus]
MLWLAHSPGETIDVARNRAVSVSTIRRHRQPRWHLDDACVAYGPAHRSADLLQDADGISDGQTGHQAVISGALMVFDMDTGDALLKAIRRTLPSAASAKTSASSSRKTGQALVESI